MSDFDTAVQRLTAWLRDFGPTKTKPFVDDVTIVLLAAQEANRIAKRLAETEASLAYSKAIPCISLEESLNENDILRKRLARAEAIIQDVKKYVDESNMWSAGPAFFGILLSKLDGPNRQGESNE